MAHGASSTSTTTTSATSATGATTRAPRDRSPQAVEARWQQVWDELGVFRARDDGSAPRRYLLTMFPYPSGDLHMGHAEVFALEDVVARYWRQLGYDVLNPVGWDSFGLPAENAAIRRGEHPSVFTYANIETQARSIRRYGVSFDWTRRLHTSDPEYYRWTQWLFLRLHERGLAYRRRSAVNWCPQDQTVLANEQVVQGRCERCGTAVTRRELSQWYLRITSYADRLLDDMAQLGAGWPEPVLAMQRHWIGRSTGAHLRFAVVGHDEPVTVFTTRPDTLGDATFLVVAPDGPLADALCAPGRRAALDAHLVTVRHRSELDRTAAVGDAGGVPLGVCAVHPVDGRRLPVWAADYVLPDHGTGAVMGVPAHDERDAGFAVAHGLPARGPVPDQGPDQPQDVRAAVDRAVADAEAGGYGEAAVGYRLRDWLVSRQRYWGTPIPMVHCAACGEVRVRDADLPVTLPDLRGADLTPRGVSPLAAAEDWVTTTCPECGGPATRDTDTMDTFVDSSWYFLRYCSPGATDAPFDPAEVRRWMPATRYVGGVEHAILHLLYSRFVTKVLHDMGLVEPVEPFTSLLNQGQVVNQGRAMSKSLGNGVELGAQLDAYGIDAVRLTMVFAGPPEEDIDWADVSPAGTQRFLARALRLADDVTAPVGADPRTGDVDLRRRTHRTVRDVTALLDTSRFNVVVARAMELVSAVRRAIDSGPGAGDPAVREATEVVAVVLSLVAPYTAEEMWAALGHDPSVATAGWPVPDPALLVEATVTAVVQVQGRVRARLDVPADVDEETLRRLALDLPEVHRALDGRPVARTVVRAPHLVNVVPGTSGVAAG